MKEGKEEDGFFLYIQLHLNVSVKSKTIITETCGQFRRSTSE